MPTELRQLVLVFDPLDTRLLGIAVLGDVMRIDINNKEFSACLGLSVQPKSNTPASLRLYFSPIVITQCEVGPWRTSSSAQGWEVIGTRALISTSTPHKSAGSYEILISWIHVSVQGRRFGIYRVQRADRGQAKAVYSALRERNIWEVVAISNASQLFRARCIPTRIRTMMHHVFLAEVPVTAASTADYSCLNSELAHVLMNWYQQLLILRGTFPHETGDVVPTWAITISYWISPRHEHFFSGYQFLRQVQSRSRSDYSMFSMWAYEPKVTGILGNPG